MAAEGAKQIKEVKGLLYTADYEFRPGRIRIEGDRIAEVDFCTKGELSEAERGMLVLPGLVDIHFHGAAGYDFCDGTQEAYRAIEAYENSHGITSICPATMTLPVEQLKQILTEVSEDKPDSLVGVHLEGPFINKAKKGAQKEEYVIPPSAEVLKELQKCAKGLVKLVSIAPETEGAIDCIRELGKEFHFSIAHTMSDYDTAVKAIQAGAKHITHLYNAMPVPTHREPAVVGAAADDPEVMPELICDGIHIHPCMVRNTFRLFGAHRMILISDSMRAVGMEDGQYTPWAVRMLPYVEHWLPWQTEPLPEAPRIYMTVCVRLWKWESRRSRQSVRLPSILQSASESGTRSAPWKQANTRIS